MSKIFDALKKVQAEAVGKRVPAAPVQEPSVPKGDGATDVVGGFAAEMVSMRFSLESKISHAHKALTFTCSVPDEGVSTVSRMFAQVLAQDPELNVLLVDANMHGPSVHSAFGAEMGGGLTDVLNGRMELDKCVRSTAIPRLNILPAGEPVIAPIQAFASEQMKKTISDLHSAYDYVIFDAPPVLANAETSVLSSQTDGVVLVIEAVRTKKEVVRKAVEVISKAGGQVLGLVLNKNKHFVPEFIYKRV